MQQRCSLALRGVFGPACDIAQREVYAGNRVEHDVSTGLRSSGQECCSCWTLAQPGLSRCPARAFDAYMPPLQQAQLQHARNETATITTTASNIVSAIRPAAASWVGNTCSASQANTPPSPASKQASKNVPALPFPPCPLQTWRCQALQASCFMAPGASSSQHRWPPSACQMIARRGLGPAAASCGCWPALC